MAVSAKPVEPLFLKTPQAVEYLGVSAETLHRLAALKIIPGFKPGKRWLFRKEALDDWMTQQSLALKPKQLGEHRVG